MFLPLSGLWAGEKTAVQRAAALKYAQWYTWRTLLGSSCQTVFEKEGINFTILTTAFISCVCVPVQRKKERTRGKEKRKRKNYRRNERKTYRRIRSVGGRSGRELKMLQATSTATIVPTLSRFEKAYGKPILGTANGIHTKTPADLPRRPGYGRFVLLWWSFDWHNFIIPHPLHWLCH